MLGPPLCCGARYPEGGSQSVQNCSSRHAARLVLGQHLGLRGLGLIENGASIIRLAYPAHCRAMRPPTCSGGCEVTRGIRATRSLRSIVLGLRCSCCPGSAPMPKLLGLSPPARRAADSESAWPLLKYVQCATRGLGSSGPDSCLSTVPPRFPDVDRKPEMAGQRAGGSARRILACAAGSTRDRIPFAREAHPVHAKQVPRRGPDWTKLMAARRRVDRGRVPLDRPESFRAFRLPGGTPL